MVDPRVRIKFERRFAADSSPGKVFSWLMEGYDDTTTDLIVTAVKVLFLPLALAETGESEETVNDAIKKSRRIFEEKMNAAHEPYYKAPENSRNTHLLGAVPVVAQAVATSQNGRSRDLPQSAELVQDEFELDDDKLFDD